MPTFFARRYIRKLETVGRTENVIGVIILLLVASIMVAFVVHVASDRNYLFNVGAADERGSGQPGGSAAGERAAFAVEGLSSGTPADAGTPSAGAADNPFPEPGVGGWQAPRRVERYTADDLYVKIDGRDGAYLKYHVVGLMFGSYSVADDAARTIDVYWYDMGTAANAVGMYESEKPPDTTSVPFGRPGYQAGGAVFFCQGASYVQVLPSRPDERDGPAALRIAEAVAARIRDK